MEKSIGALAPLKTKLGSRTLRASAQLARAVNRAFVALEGKGILRASAEESTPASKRKAREPCAAEFIRAFRRRDFHGKRYFHRFDAPTNSEATATWDVVLPRAGRKTTVFDEACACGFRGDDPSPLHSSPREPRGSNFSVCVLRA